VVIFVYCRNYCRLCSEANESRVSVIFTHVVKAYKPIGFIFFQMFACEVAGVKLQQHSH